MPRHGRARSSGNGVTDRHIGASSPPPDAGPRLLDAAPRRAGPMYIADDGGRLLMTNPAFDDLLAAGWDAGAANGGAANGADMAPGALREIFRRLENGDVNVDCDETFGADGTRRRFRSSHYRFDDADGGTAFAGHYVEVSLDGEGPGAGAARPATASLAAAAAKNAFLGKIDMELGRVQLMVIYVL